MAINESFAVVINDLIQRATGGTAAQIIDEKSFIDFGKKLADMDGDDFANKFAGALANRIKLSIDTVRDYDGKYKSLIRGKTTPGAIIQMITHGFFDVRQPSFVTLDENTNLNQWEINKGTQDAHYYILENAYQIPVTVQYVELEGAFDSFSAMEAFLNDKIRMALSSNELAREEGRAGLVGALIKDLDAETAVDSVEGCGQKYNLLALYNETYNASLTSANCLYNGEFIKFATNMIKKVRGKMANVSTSFNKTGIKTFTPKNDADAKLMIHGALDGGIATYVVQDVRRPESLGNYEVVPYWQSESNPFVVSFKGAGAAEVESSKVLAVLFDKYAMGEWVTHERVLTTQLNARTETTNTWINVQTRYCILEDANAVIFTIEDED